MIHFDKEAVERPSSRAATGKTTPELHEASASGSSSIGLSSLVKLSRKAAESAPEFFGGASNGHAAPGHNKAKSKSISHIGSTRSSRSSSLAIPAPMVRRHSNQSLVAGSHGSGTALPRALRHSRDRASTVSSTGSSEGLYRRLNRSSRSSRSFLPALFRSSSSNKSTLGQDDAQSPNVTDDLQAPDPEGSDTPESYLQRLCSTMPVSFAFAAVSQRSDSFYLSCLCELLRKFDFAEYPLDIALRRFLMLVVLPQETAHIDRLLDQFARRYYECNPSLYPSSEQCYFLSFAMLILNTDAFNPNNKDKMRKHEFCRISRTDGVPLEMLEYFYDNVTFAPFIRLDEGYDMDTLMASSSGIPLTRRSKSDTIEPYTSMLDGSIWKLRVSSFLESTSLDLDVTTPSIKSCESTEDDTNSARRFTYEELSSAFCNCHVLQIGIVTSRSASAVMDMLPQRFSSIDALSGFMDREKSKIAVARMGIVARKETRMRKSVWRTYGALLTHTQFMLFRDFAWIEQYLVRTSDNKNREDNISSRPFKVWPLSSLFAYQEGQNQGTEGFSLAVKNGCEEVFWTKSPSSSAKEWMAMINFGAAKTEFAHFCGAVNDGMPSLQRDAAELKDSLVSCLSTLDDFVLKLEVQLATNATKFRNICSLIPLQHHTRVSLLNAAFNTRKHHLSLVLQLEKVRAHRQMLATEHEEWLARNSNRTVAEWNETSADLSSELQVEKPELQLSTSSLASDSKARLVGDSSSVKGVMEPVALNTSDGSSIPKHRRTPSYRSTGKKSLASETSPIPASISPTPSKPKGLVRRATSGRSVYLHGRKCSVIRLKEELSGPGSSGGQRWSIQSPPRSVTPTNGEPSLADRSMSPGSDLGAADHFYDALERVDTLIA